MTFNIIDQINALDILRYNLLDHGEDNEKNAKKIDFLASNILNLISFGFDDLNFEFIVHHLSRLGMSVNLLYDDNGNWAIGSDGFQNISPDSEPTDTDMYFYIPKKSWQSSPSKALKYFLDDIKNEINDNDVNEAIKGFIDE